MLTTSPALGLHQNLTPDVLPFAAVRMTDVAQVGGKNASLGELIGQLSTAGVRVPDGFATTADAFRRHLASTGLGNAIREILTDLDVNDIIALARTGARIRAMIESSIRC